MNEYAIFWRLQIGTCTNLRRLSRPRLVPRHRLQRGAAVRHCGPGSVRLSRAAGWRAALLDDSVARAHDRLGRQCGASSRHVEAEAQSDRVRTQWHCVGPGGCRDAQPRTKAPRGRAGLARSAPPSPPLNPLRRRRPNGLPDPCLRKGRRPLRLSPVPASSASTRPKESGRQCRIYVRRATGGSVGDGEGGQ